MNVSPSKENILKKIRQALSESTPIPFPQSEGNSSVFQPSSQELEMQFAEEFSNLQGKFIFCLDNKELAASLHQLIQQKEWSKIYCSENDLKQPLQMSGFNTFSNVSV